MPPDANDPTKPEEWLRRARSSMARARAGRVHPDVLFEDLCFDAQQAAEKALKAVLVRRKTPFPKTHDISELLTLLHQAGTDVPEDIRRAAMLTPYAVEARYPGLGEEVTAQEHAQAVTTAERVLAWAESLLSNPPS